MNLDYDFESYEIVVVYNGKRMVLNFDDIFHMLDYPVIAIEKQMREAIAKDLI